ncbi:hypothetical protein ACFOU2_03450 [Bacillus songklensis]|uniref:Flagellar hook-length control protein FliK n=1 Tax=Bacillus songklensis TaxID=1069116 RepID=A0ABV8B073_9BACI
MILSSVDKLFHYVNGSQAKLVEFAPGDIIRGKVIKLFPNQTAVVEFNGSPLVAKLHAPLMNHTAYWFEVRPKVNGQLQLKVLTTPQSLAVEGENVMPLLKELHLPVTKINEKLVLSLTEKGLPLPKKEMPAISDWLSSGSKADSDFQAIEQIIKMKLPFTKEIFLSIRSLHDGSSFTQQLQTLFSFLENKQALTGEELQLKEAISRLLFPLQWEKGTEVGGTLSGLTGLTNQEKAAAENPALLRGEKGLGEVNEAKELTKAFKYILQSLGLEHEREINQYFKSGDDKALKGEFPSLKALLLQFQHQHGSGEERELVDPLIHKITGYQLLTREDGPVTSMYMQLPVLLGKEVYDVSMQWEGRQKGNGEIDPSYCRILFYLHLAHLKDTVVDVTVQNRIVNIAIINDHPCLSALTKKLGAALKENLSAIHYHLSDIKVVKSVQEQKNRGFLTKRAPVYQQTSPYSGVDLKV